MREKEPVIKLCNLCSPEWKCQRMGNITMVTMMDMNGRIPWLKVEACINGAESPSPRLRGRNRLGR